MRTCDCQIKPLTVERIAQVFAFLELAGQGVNNGLPVAEVCCSPFGAH